MATRKELRTFRHIVDAIMDLLKVQSSDTVTRNRIKSDVQRFYMDEVIPFHQWPFLRGKINIQTKAYYGTGTASVTQNSVTVTLTAGPSDSKTGQLFSVNGTLDVYKIRSHTAGSTTITLDTPYIGTTAATASFKVWTDIVLLPVETDDIIEITHPTFPKPIDGMGLQELRRLSAANPKVEGRPRAYCMTGWADPSPYISVSAPASLTRASSGTLKTIVFGSTLGATSDTTILKVGDRIRVTGSSNYDYNIDAIVANVSTTSSTNDTITYTGTVARTESSTSDTALVVTKQSEESYERQNQLLVHPSISDKATQLSIDYIKDIAPLDEDSDEPIIPLKDRVVLFWGGAFYAFSRERNPEEAMLYRTLADNRLAKMAGKTTESIDKPSLIVSSTYIDSKRNPLRSRFSRDSLGSSFGSSGSSNPQGTANQVAIFDSSGSLTSSPTISTTELTYLDGADSNIQDQLDAITTLADGKILVGNASNVATEVTPSGDITMDRDGVTAIGTGVIVNADISASAAIARSKTAAGTAYRILANNVSGVMSENAALTAAKNVITDANGQLATTNDVYVSETGTQTLTNKTIDSDSNIITNIVNADIKSTAAIELSKLETIATASILGRDTASTGAIEVLSATEATAVLNVFAQDTKGLVTGPTAAEIAANKLLRADNTWAAAATGTVTSVAAAGPTGIATWSAAVTGSGTLTQTLSDQDANKVLAGPTTGSAAAPTFRALVEADLPAIQGQVRLNGGNGYGSTNTCIRRFTTAEVNTGTAITYADSATNGATFTINSDGLYAISYADGPTADNIGISLSSNQLTTSISTITAAHRLIFSAVPASQTGQCSITTRLVATDVIRAHSAGNQGNVNLVKFEIIKIGN
jgi:hypothetical protein